MKLAARKAARRALLIVVSAPSGSGKTTLCNRLRAEFPGISYSVSCTTRAPRGAEKDGEDYHFLTERQFERRLKRGDFLEHAAVHGHRYGTLRKTVAAALRAGRHVLMDIDVQGARQIREAARRAPPADPLRRGFTDIFIHAPTIAELRRRLERRGEDAPEDIRARLKTARTEMTSLGEFRHVVVNDRLDRAYAEIRRILVGEMKRNG
jgi:guanylate kinase